MPQSCGLPCIVSLLRSNNMFGQVLMKFGVAFHLNNTMVEYTHKLHSSL